MKYDKPFSPEESCIIKAGIFIDGELQRKASEVHYYKHLGLGKLIELKKKPNWKYGPETNAGLFDGIRGAENYGDGKWIGFQGKDLIAEIDLLDAEEINQISFGYFNHAKAWILPPKSVSLYVSSDGKSYKEYFQQELNLDKQNETDHLDSYSIQLKGESFRYLKLLIENYKKLPADHVSAGNNSWLFVDEIVIE